MPIEHHNVYLTMTFVTRTEHIDSEKKFEEMLHHVRTQLWNFGGCAEDILLIVIPSRQQKVGKLDSAVFGEELALFTQTSPR